MMVIAVEPVIKRGGPSRLRAVDADIGPLVEEGAIEALHLPIRARRIGPCATMPYPEFGTGTGEKAAAVCRAIVGEDSLGPDTPIREPGHRTLPEGDCSHSAFIGKHLAIGEAGMVIDHGMDVGIANPGLLWHLAPTVDAPATTVGDTPQLLDVHMQEVAGPGMFVAADDAAAGPVEPGKPLQAETPEDAVDSRGGYAQAIPDTCRAKFLTTSKSLDPLLLACRTTPRAVTGSRRAIVEPRFALSLPTTPPTRCGLTGEAHFRCDVRNRSTRGNAFDEQQASRRS